MTKRIDQTYRLKFGFSFLFNTLIGFGLFGFAVFFLLRFDADATVIVITILFAAIDFSSNKKVHLVITFF